jgi:hypothetical protein
MNKYTDELIAKKSDLEHELQLTVEKLHYQIHLIEDEIRDLSEHPDMNFIEIDEPQAPWNIEHEGLIFQRDYQDVHLFEREQVYENIHE